MKAAIFDMDGTLIDSMPYWRRLNSAYVRSCGIVPTEEEEKEMYSMGGMLVVSYFREHFHLDCTFDELCSEACKGIERVYAAGVPLKPGTAEYLNRLKKQGVRCYVATATPARLAMIALNRAGLVAPMDGIYTTDMLGMDKSNPAFFDTLCGMIGERKEDCVMHEDALYAMKGARSAGLGVIGITDGTSLKDREEIRRICDVLVDSYDELENRI